MDINTSNQFLHTQVASMRLNYSLGTAVEKIIKASRTKGKLKEALLDEAIYSLMEERQKGDDKK